MHIPHQKSPDDCGICCVAALTGLSYAKALKACRPFTNKPRDNINFARLPKIFTKLHRRTHIKRGKKQDLQNNSLCEVTYRQNGEIHWHYIVWWAKQKRVLDPSQLTHKRFTFHRAIEIVEENKGLQCLRSKRQKIL